MNPTSSTKGFDEYNSHVFEVTLDRKPEAELWKLQQNKDTEKLQNLFNLATQYKDDKVKCSKYINEYQATLDQLQSDGKREFTLTKGKVSELVEDPAHKTMKVPIKIQIKEGVLTWYFEAPMDQTTQSFRDEVFLAAGLAQVNVDHARFRYLRGTNSLHVKKMHTQEAESLMNHNHYILDKGEDFTPERVKQHLNSFVQAERELTKKGYIQNASSEVGKEKFLNQAEADAIVKKYEEHWNKITKTFDTVKVKQLDNPTDGWTTQVGVSELEEKKELGQKRLTKEDRNEWVKYNNEFNTVTASGFKKVDNPIDGWTTVVQKDQILDPTFERVENPADGWTTVVPTHALPGEKDEFMMESKTYINQKSHFTINPEWPLTKRIEAVKKAMRGGHSNRAQVRQMEHSNLPELAEINKMNDAVKVDQSKKKSKN